MYVSMHIYIDFHMCICIYVYIYSHVYACICTVFFMLLRNLEFGINHACTIFNLG